MDSAGERPPKRQRTASVERSSHKQQNNDVSSKKYKFSHMKHKNGFRTKTQLPAEGNGDGLDRPRLTERKQVIRTFSQPSVMNPGDKGIFVTCDKGREKKSLLELHDLVLEHLEQEQGTRAHQDEDRDEGAQGEERADNIEADIAAELNSLRDNGSLKMGSSSRPMQLITLDVPCVSFLRFPPDSTLDPTQIVHSICQSAADKTTPQSSRYIKRLTPLTSLGKTLSDGLAKACEAVLPNIFGRDREGMVNSIKFAIRPTVRNNDKLGRDEIIKLVADRVQDLGDNAHKVDLKHYEKGIIVEVYRGWVGMSVVDNTSQGAYRMGFEELKRFNLAEIYASRDTVQMEPVP